MEIGTDERVRTFVAYSPGTTRAEIGQQLRLAAPTVTSAVRRLLTTGDIVEDTGTGARQAPGRPSRLLRAPGPDPLLGLIHWQDGAAHISLLGFDGSVRLTIPLTEAASPAGTDDLDAAVTQLRHAAGKQPGTTLTAIVISAPAPLRHSTGGTGPAFAVSITADLRHRLARRHELPVLVENDANLAALGELHHGDPAARSGNFLYLAIGKRGFGAAIILGGTLVRGAHGYAGELAHLQIDTDGPLCACDGRGCLRSQIDSLVMDTAQAAFTRTIAFSDLAGLAVSGNAGASRILHDIGRALGRPLAHLCTFLDPERVIADTTIGPAIEPIVAGIREAFTTHAPPVIARDVTITLSRLGSAAELRGALELPRETARRPPV
ncbi:ROK family protein [Actinoplanes sp. CA-015351]|uniref:ROK family protein n=1 Tax=Actinoplanes sp. CA-015351 TaxID=3239897 RepID=UPI003D9832E6